MSHHSRLSWMPSLGFFLRGNKMYTLEDMKFINDNLEKKFNVLLCQKMSYLTSIDLTLDGINFDKLGKGTTKDKYLIYDISDFPTIAKYEDGNQIEANLYTLDVYDFIKLKNHFSYLDLVDVKLTDDTTCYMFLSNVILRQVNVSPDSDGIIRWKK